MLPQRLQMHLQVGSSQVGQYCFLPGDPGRCQAIARHFDRPELVAHNREFLTYTGLLDGTMVSVCSTGIGGPGAAIAVEEMVKCGVHTFIRVGTCGGIDLKVMGGDLIVATGAVRQEGLSREYMPIEYPATADFSVALALRDAALAAGRRVHTGIVQSKDSFYGQHAPETMPTEPELRDKWLAWQRGHVLGSEMETAAIFVVAQVRAARAGSLLHVLWNQERQAAGMSNPIEHDAEPAIQTAVDAMRRLIAQDKGL